MNFNELSKVEEGGIFRNIPLDTEEEYWNPSIGGSSIPDRRNSSWQKSGFGSGEAIPLARVCPGVPR